MADRRNRWTSQDRLLAVLCRWEADSGPNGVVVGEIERIDARALRLQPSEPDPVEVHGEIVKSDLAGRNGGRKPVPHHEIAYPVSLRTPHRDRQYMLHPIEPV